MRAEILATGDEIRTGALVDSNSAYIADRLEGIGVEVTRHHAVGDHLETLAAVFREMAGRCEVAVVTGGLGPTQDDLSSAAAAAAAGVQLVEDARALAQIEAFFAKRGRPMTASNRKQALFPQGAHCLYNALGTAPGFQMALNGCTLFFLPGVPNEMRAMLGEQVLPQLEQLQGSQRRHRLVRVISTFGQTESAVGETLAGLTDRFPQVTLGLRAKFPEIQVKLYLNTADRPAGEAMLAQAVAYGVERLQPYVFSLNERTMAAKVGAMLLQRGETLALAESCTGGLAANWITNTPGSSDYFLLSAVTYANAGKVKLLGVSEQTLAEKGAVDEETARQMAEGVRRVAGADYGLATTGIAGPDGGTPDKPVGTICIGLATAKETLSRRHTLSFGRRLMNKRLFATLALDLLRKYITGDLKPR
ncbi:MAG: competence/damage-inducible protein A [Desulfatitalea sp.]|nr:competence/damage-inducible protein A [Desulfatitalea sp.]NNK02435.1 competence/damage-inducible protein A [Desulfatitalea sp.]